jgi:hypothetical protein
MIADRIRDVLEDGMVRFTHLINTNDSFEIRKTFKSFTGPKFKKLMNNAIAETMTPERVEDQLKSSLADRGLRISTSRVRQLLKQQTGMTIEDALRAQVGVMLDMFAQTFDEVKKPEDFLEELGSQILCFSLSERFDLPAMWAHYGGGHTGVVVVFDTNNEWFKRDNKPNESKLQKIIYFDDQLDEPFENLQAAFSSKTIDWASEREWRLNCSIKHIEKTVDLGSDQIHLRSFPPRAVSAIIIGSKASPATIDEVRDVTRRKYPHAKLQQTAPQRMAGTFTLVEL